MDCQDKARDSMGANASDSERQKATEAMEKCVVKCADDVLSNIPILFRRLKDTLAKSK